MFFHYGIALLALLWMGTDAETEIFITDRDIMAQRIIDRRHFLDRETLRQKPVIDEDLSRLLTEFGGVHVMRLLRDFGSPDSSSIDSDLILGLEDVSSVIAALGGLGRSGTDFNDVSRILTDLERRGLRRDGDDGRTKDVMDAIRGMTGNQSQGKGDSGRTDNTEIRQFINRGIEGTGSDNVLTEDDLLLLLHLLVASNAKDVSSMTNEVSKRGGTKGESEVMGRTSQGGIGKQRDEDVPFLRSFNENSPLNLGQERVDSGDSLDPLQLLLLLQQLQNTQETAGNELQNNALLSLLDRGGNIIAEGAGAALGFGLGSLFTLVSITTLNTLAGLAQASLGTRNNANGPLVTNRNFGDETENIPHTLEGRTRSNFDADVITSDNKRTTLQDSDLRANLDTGSGKISRTEDTNKSPDTVIIRTINNPGRDFDRNVGHTQNTGQINTKEDIRQQNEGARQKDIPFLSQREFARPGSRDNGRRNNGKSHQTENINNQQRQDTAELTVIQNSPGDTVLRESGRQNIPDIPETLRGSSQNQETRTSTTRRLTPLNPKTSQKGTTTRKESETADIVRNRKQPSENFQTAREQRDRTNTEQTNQKSSRSRTDFYRVFGGPALPADILYRAAIMGESPSFIFGGSAYSTGTATRTRPFIQRGIVRHVGSYISRAKPRDEKIHVYESQGR